MAIATKQCENCLLDIKEYERVCHHCGFPQPERPRSNAARAERLATAALVLGVCGIVIGIVPFVLSIAAIVVGGRSKRALPPDRPGVVPIANAGIVLGWVGVVVAFVWLAVLISLSRGP